MQHERILPVMVLATAIGLGCNDRAPGRANAEPPPAPSPVVAEAEESPSLGRMERLEEEIEAEVAKAEVHEAKVQEALAADLETPRRAERRKGLRLLFGKAPAEPGAMFTKAPRGALASDAELARLARYGFAVSGDPDERVVEIEIKDEADSLTTCKDLTLLLLDAWDLATDDEGWQYWLDPARGRRARLERLLPCTLKFEPYTPLDGVIDNTRKSPIPIWAIGRPESDLHKLWGDNEATLPPLETDEAPIALRYEASGTVRRVEARIKLGAAPTPVLVGALRKRIEALFGPAIESESAPQLRWNSKPPIAIFARDTEVRLVAGDYADVDP